MIVLDVKVYGTLTFLLKEYCIIQSNLVDILHKMIYNIGIK